MSVSIQPSLCDSRPHTVNGRLAPPPCQLSAKQHPTRPRPDYAPLPITKKGKKMRPMVYGYTLHYKWLEEKGLEAIKDVPATDKRVKTDWLRRDFAQRYMEYVVINGADMNTSESGVRIRGVRLNDDNHRLVRCIALASNTSRNALVLPPRTNIDKLKQILETEEEPQWYELD